MAAAEKLKYERPGIQPITVDSAMLEAYAEFQKVEADMTALRKHLVGRVKGERPGVRVMATQMTLHLFAAKLCSLAMALETERDDG